MPVWFVYRSFDMGPTGKHVRRFEDDTVLGWFQRNWDHLAAADRAVADERVVALLGCSGWPHVLPFWTAGEEGHPPPGDMDELLSRMRASFGDEDVQSTSPHVLEMMTEDDGEGGAVYFFDGHFLAECGHLAAYLLNEDWRLPSGHGEGGFVPKVETTPWEPDGAGAGTTYVVLLTQESKYPIDDLEPARRFDGVRLPDLARHLITSAASAGEHDYQRQWLPGLLLAGATASGPLEEAFLRAIRADPSDAATWAAWSDWREERGAEPPGVGLLRGAFGRISSFPRGVMSDLPRGTDAREAAWKVLSLKEANRDKLFATPRSLFHVEGHLAQLCLHMAEADYPYFHQWIFFDDLWAGAHPDLANALLRYAARWDVLSGD